MRIRILGAHNCESQATRCVCILINDRLAIDAGGLTSNLSISDQQKIEAILLTHQHYDHIRDVPMVALTLYRCLNNVEVYSTPDVLDTIETHLLNGVVYPRFQEIPKEKPTISLNAIVPYEYRRINGYSILPVPVNHDGITVGYQISDAKGKTIFYSADTGPGLTECWKCLSPQLLIIDGTMPDSFQKFAAQTGHLTPSLLNEELVKFREIKGYLPQIVLVHMDPVLEKETTEEIKSISEALNTPIIIAYEGMKFNI